MTEPIIVKGGKVLYKLYCDNEFLHGCYNRREVEIMAARGNERQPGKWHIKEVVKAKA